jgi:hypothetical protein
VAPFRMMLGEDCKALQSHFFLLLPGLRVTTDMSQAKQRSSPEHPPGPKVEFLELLEIKPAIVKCLL